MLNNWQYSKKPLIEAIIKGVFPIVALLTVATMFKGLPPFDDVHSMMQYIKVFKNRCLRLQKEYLDPLRNLIFPESLLTYYSMQPYKVWCVHFHFQTTTLIEIKT